MIRAKGVARREDRCIAVTVWTDETEADIIKQLMGEDPGNIAVSKPRLSFSQGQCSITFTIQAAEQAGDTITFEEEAPDETPHPPLTPRSKSPISAPAAGTAEAVREAGKAKIISAWKGKLG